MRVVRLTLLIMLVAHTQGNLPGESPGSIPLGISKVEPAIGPSVPIDGVLMVPYEQPIPGTDISISMIPVPGGTFTLGSPDSEADREESEGPQIKVRVAPMWVAQTEVTWQQYREYMNLHDIFQHFSAEGERSVDGVTTIDAVTAPTPLYDPSFTFEYGEEPNQPAVTMTQYAAKQFSKWLSGITGLQYRLPTEAEWEYAARGGTQTAYYWGDTMQEADDHAWYFDNSDSAPEAVGLKNSNAFGLQDMLGGVGEWTVNQFEPEGYAVYVDKQPINAIEVIRWPTIEDAGVVRGGNWKSNPEELRCASRLVAEYVRWRERDPNDPKSPWWCTDDPTRGIGFRLFRSYEPLDRALIQKFWDANTDEINEVVQFKVRDGRSYYGKVDPALPNAIKAIGH